MRNWLLVIGLVLALSPVLAESDPTADSRTARTLPYTSQLLVPDRAEVDHLTIDQVGHITGITSTHPLTAEDAAKLAKLWRGLTYGFHYSTGCHLPGFSIRFYQGKKLIAEESICFTCGSIFFRKSDLLQNLNNPGWQGFDRHNPAATALLTYLKNLFPETFSHPA